MPKNRFECVNHFRFVVTTSAGGPTCRECGRGPTAAEAAQIKTLVDWEQARLKGAANPRRRH